MTLTTRPTTWLMNDERGDNNQGSNIYGDDTKKVTPMSYLRYGCVFFHEDRAAEHLLNPRADPSLSQAGRISGMTQRSRTIRTHETRSCVGYRALTSVYGCQGERDGDAFRAKS
ncbi:hypothetical protein BgiBS90_000572 [Biomphalaria glabrata]|nr:hypothetical protein BgiBS90_000572 [Biomphalaria glabrata]